MSLETLAVCRLVGCELADALGDCFQVRWRRRLPGGPDRLGDIPRWGKRLLAEKS
jgi:hypothetical protein